MNELLKMRLFSLLAESSQVTNEEMQDAYGNFVKHIEAVYSENDYKTVYRNLSNTRIELLALESLNLYEQEKKCPKKSISTQIFIRY